MGHKLAELIAQNPAAWDELRNVVPHPELLRDSHGTWLQVANTACEKLAAGMRFARVDIDPDELTEWCSAHRCPVDAEARARFAAEKLRQRDVSTRAAAGAASAYRRQLPPASDPEGAPRDRED
jgi:hypothetical protein